MRFSTEGAVAQATRWVAVPGAFDGSPPVPHLEVCLNLPNSPSGDRLAVGLALVFGPWLAGPMHAPEPVSALTAQRITDFFGDRFVSVTSVTDASLPIPRGTDVVSVIDFDTTPELSVTTGSVLQLPPLGLREGGTSFGRRHTIASNVHMFDTSRIGQCAVQLQTLGLAVILAEFIDANVFVHPAADSGFPALGALLESVGLGLSAG